MDSLAFSQIRVSHCVHLPFWEHGIEMLLSILLFPKLTTGSTPVRSHSSLLPQWQANSWPWIPQHGHQVVSIQWAVKTDLLCSLPDSSFNLGVITGSQQPGLNCWHGLVGLLILLHQPSSRTPNGFHSILLQHKSFQHHLTNPKRRKSYCSH